MGFFVVDWLFVFPLCGFSLSLFCNYEAATVRRSMLQVLILGGIHLKSTISL